LKDHNNYPIGIYLNKCDLINERERQHTNICERQFFNPRAFGGWFLILCYVPLFALSTIIIRYLVSSMAFLSNMLSIINRIMPVIF